MKVALIDYGSGNLRSAAKAFERVADADVSVVVTADPNEVAQATHIVLPGVGAFRDCRDGVAAIPGMMETLTRCVIDQKKPFLGICVGMQLMATVGREHGDTPGFGWIAGEVAKLDPPTSAFKIPHMGWNDLQFHSGAHPALEKLRPGWNVYFVHSYAFRAESVHDVIATVDYGGSIAAIIARENMLSTQFHPEKSQRVGLNFLAGFLRWKP